MSGEWTVRPASINDARAIAQVHVASWRSAYRGILPDSLLNGLSMEGREAMWRGLLDAPEPSSSITLVGCDASNKVAGFISGGKERTGQLGCDGEIYAIYLLDEAQRKGLGAQLVGQLARDLAVRGFSSMAVWVLALNPARRFYERLGAELIGQQEIELGGQTFIEVAYGWKSLKVFL
jgi:ribosomal protein S18 acetylase RimI-like enzyme